MISYYPIEQWESIVLSYVDPTEMKLVAFQRLQPARRWRLLAMTSDGASLRICRDASRTAVRGVIKTS